jgi:hypothetical protein
VGNVLCAIGAVRVRKTVGVARALRHHLLASASHVVRVLLALMLATQLAACGGGSNDEPQTLYVTFEYTNTTVTGGLFQSIEVSPTLDGLSGHTPTFRTADPLPPGLSLNSRTGVISGVTTAPFLSNPVTVILSVDGYEGELSATTWFSITSQFSVSYQVSRLTLGVPVSVIPTVAGLTAQDTVSFTIEPAIPQVTTGALPAGLSLNPLTGEISGTPTQVSNVMPGQLGDRVDIGMLVTRESNSYKAIARGVSLTVTNF